jgi:MHS family shikimate/dehydroshikimate transporter-like MFS transporter
MDSTLTSTHPNEETPSLNRARRAALGSFAGAVVDWYDFLLYGITAALVFNREFFRRSAPRWAPSPRLPPSASVFCFARWAG